MVVVVVVLVVVLVVLVDVVVAGATVVVVLAAGSPCVALPTERTTMAAITAIAGNAKLNLVFHRIIVSPVVGGYCLETRSPLRA